MRAIQLKKYLRSFEDDETFVEVTKSNSTYHATGHTQKGEKEITGTLETKMDPVDHTRAVISKVTSQPKRTGAGSLLVYEFALDALSHGIKTISTDSSALEEGTPEFYKSMGFSPTIEHAMNVAKIVATEEVSEDQINRMLYSAGLDVSIHHLLENLHSTIAKWKVV